MSLRDKLRSQAALLAQPINFADLIARGVLTKGKGAWYAVRSIDELPENARAQIVGTARGGRVKFARAKPPRKTLESLRG